MIHERSIAPNHDGSQNSRQEDHALYRILGTDLDSYFNANAEAYEENKKQWTKCTLEEWQKGSEGKIFHGRLVAKL